MAAADDLPDVILLGNTDHAHLLNLLNVTSNFAVASNVSGGFRDVLYIVVWWWLLLVRS